MKIILKIPGFLHEGIMRDLARPHPFAAERVGFVLARLGQLPQGRLVLLTKYLSIPDHHYVHDRLVGARIGPEAMTSAMQAVYHGRQNREGIFHIHQHPHEGETGMSQTDFRELPKLIPGFQSVGGEAPHGIIILSRNHGSGWIWLPSKDTPIAADSLCVIGCPLGVFEKGRSR
jgi:hypothetical protein